MLLHRGVHNSSEFEEFQWLQMHLCTFFACSKFQALQALGGIFGSGPEDGVTGWTAAATAAATASAGSAAAAAAAAAAVTAAAVATLAAVAQQYS